MASVLVISESEEAFGPIKSSFPVDFQIKEASDRESAFELISKDRPRFVFIDIGLLKEPDSGSKVNWALQRIWSLSPISEVIVMTPKEVTRDAVRAVKAGASEFITYPITAEEVRYTIDSINEYTTLQTELEYLRDHFWDSDSLAMVQTKHPEMQKVFERIRLVASTNATVLLTGETGTGKGVLAKLIHNHSNRKNNQFVEVHCGAIPDNLLESELFGHEKGAFTGAVRQKLGKFEIAHGGTIFLDEVGTLTPPAQIKLLKVLQDGIFQRVGGEETIQVDVRVISATNLDLGKACEQGQFRLDLYYRLNVFAIKIPSLRERIDDIPYFVDLFMQKWEKITRKNIRAVHPNVLEAFNRYPWPGNIRELENLMERAFILGHSPILDEDDFPEEIIGIEPFQSNEPLDFSPSLAEVRRRAVNAAESFYIRELLSKHKGRIHASAEAAGITTRQLNKLMVKHNIDKKAFRNE
jgi:DNA-binding NtrC family response regulator